MGDDDIFKSATDIANSRNLQRASANSRFFKCCKCDAKNVTVKFRKSDDYRCNNCHTENQRELRAIKRNEIKETREEINLEGVLPESPDHALQNKENMNKQSDDMNNQMVLDGKTIIVNNDEDEHEVQDIVNGEQTENNRGNILNNERCNKENDDIVLNRDSNITERKYPVLNEVLTYISNKMDLIPKDLLVKICADFYTVEELESAKNVAFKTCPTMSRKIKRQGNEKSIAKKNVEDIIDLFSKCNTEMLPVFVARNLQNIPPIDITHVDVTQLTSEVNELKKMQKKKSETQHR